MRSYASGWRAMAAERVLCDVRRRTLQILPAVPTLGHFLSVSADRLPPSLTGTGYFVLAPRAVGLQAIPACCDFVTPAGPAVPSSGEPRKRALWLQERMWGKTL